MPQFNFPNPRRRVSRAPRAPGLLLLAVCAIGGPAAAMSTLACSQEAVAAPPKAKGKSQSALWTEGRGRAIASGKYDPRISLSPMLEKAAPTVVSIQASGRTQRGMFGASVPTGGIGSGFIIRADGLVVTNAHVVTNHDSFKVHLADGRVFEAKVVGSDPQTDVALLKLEGAKNLPVAVLGKSRPVAVGDWVVAVGSPLGLEQSVTRGIVSAKGRGSLGLYADGYADFLQTDAAISPGNSGGPLFNLNGEVVGMNTAVAGIGNGLGFAVPIDQVKRVLEPLYARGEVRRGWLGISGSDVVPAVGRAPQRGAIVAGVHTGSPGAAAGLEVGDRIVKIDGEAIEDFDDLRGRIGEHGPNEAVRVQLVRDGKTKTVTVRLGERPSPTALARMGGEFGPSIGIERPKVSPKRGPSKSRPAPKTKSGGPVQLDIGVKNVDGGVRVERVGPGGLGERLGLQAGDILTEVNGRAVNSPADVRKALERSEGRISVSAKRGDGQVSSTLIGGY